MKAKCICHSHGFSSAQFSALRTLIKEKEAEEAQRIDPLRGLKIAITIDDLFLWKGIPWPEGYSPASVADELIKTFQRINVGDVYAFTATAPAKHDPKLLAIFDQWVASGHRVANHTHFHSNLNWVSPETYIRDIELGESDISRWAESGQKKYFRYGQDGWGNTREKYADIQKYLQQNSYQTAPISAWFYDTEFIAPHLRCVRCGDADALKAIRDAYVDTAVQQLRNHARLAIATTGRTPPLIFLMHATALAQDCAEKLLEKLVGFGVDFISLETAMQDPFNSDDPGLITNKFYNKTQKWGAINGHYLDDCPPQILNQLDEIHPSAGPTTQQMMTSIFEPIAREVGGTYLIKQY